MSTVLGYNNHTLEYKRPCRVSKRVYCSNICLTHLSNSAKVRVSMMWNNQEEGKRFNKDKWNVGGFFFSVFALFSFTVLKVRKAARIALKREESSCSFSVNLTCPVKWSRKGMISALPAKMDCPRLAFSTWCGTAWVSVPAAVDFQHSMQRWHCGTGWADYAELSPETTGAKKRHN